jgi:hypothetical protein
VKFGKVRKLLRKNKNIPHESFKKIRGKNPKIMERILNSVRKRYHGRSLEIDEALYQKALQGGTHERLSYGINEWGHGNVQNSQGDSKIVVIIPPELLPMSERPQGNEPKIIGMRPGKLEIINEEKEEPCIEANHNYDPPVD